MRRKYDLRNKRNFMIILILMVAIICIFSLFIYKYKQNSKILYKIEIGCVIQDVNKNYLNTSSDSELRLRWNDNYYLIYQDKQMNLGKKVIVYNTTTRVINLYGKFYEINEDGKIITHTKETKLPNSNESKFYKLDDREYLLIDKSINSSDRTINANDYLLVELDKLGNAKLSNYKLNLKTVSATTLVTSNYQFDIANEKLIFNDLEIDLKKIIGSSNQYVEEEKKNDTKNNENNNTSPWNMINNNPSNNNVINNNKQGNISSIEEIKNKAKMTSIVRITEGIRQIDVDYVVYDPYNEYKSIYAEITKSNGIDVVYLPKNDTHITFNNLAANTKYKVNFIYTTINSETEELSYHKIDEMELTTKMPEFDISVYKFYSTNKTLSYKVTLPDNYPISTINVSLTFNYKTYIDDELVTKTTTINKNNINVTPGNKYIFDIIDLSEYNIDRDKSLKLTINSINGIDGSIKVNKSSSFRFGR